jgi:thiamine kinase-like enzyme
VPRLTLIFFNIRNYFKIVPLILSTDNVVEYLQQQGICQIDRQPIEPIKPREYKNFNLIVNFDDTLNYLVKQERFDGRGKTTGSLDAEWVLHQLIDRFTELQPLQTYLSEAVNFDRDNSIIVLNYFPQYISLSSFYRQKEDYPAQIAALIGANLAQIHRLTWKKTAYQEFITECKPSRGLGKKPNFVRGLEKIDPGIFGKICENGIEFFKLYQRFPSLHQAVINLHDEFEANCLTHNDIRFANYIIRDGAIETNLQDADLRLIDWEFFAWGDPALDLGTLIAQYLEVWLDSLYVDSDTDINISLSLATCPLEKIQPSLTAAISTYKAHFPEILTERPNYLVKVTQFAGLCLIKRLQHHIEYHDPFDNRSICTMQVAKSLLCNPEAAMSTIFCC